MRSDVRLGLVVALALALAQSLAPIAVAQALKGVAPSPVTLKAGEEKEICAGVKAAVEAPKLGTLRIDGDPKGDATVRVFYKANDVTAAASETVTCTIGTDKTPIKIDVAPKSGSGSTPDPKKDTVDAGPRNKTSGFSEDIYPEAFKALFLLFVLAAVLESALAILFNWRPFVETFNARAVRPVVSLVFALAVVQMFDLDIMTAMAKLIRESEPPPDGTGRILTAMVIAGGSAAVNNLMVSLGFRQVRTPETVVVKPPLEKGWVSVSIVRTPAIEGPVTVRIGVADGAGDVPVVTSLAKSTGRIYRYFFRDPGRFPGSGGYTLHKGDKVTVKVSAAKSDGTNNLLEKTWGPNVIAEGAIIDLTFTM